MSNEFYVYGHYTKSHELFYIGKGKGYRQHSSENRSGAWNKVAAQGWYPVVLFGQLSEPAAIEKEEYLLGICPGLVNQKKSGRMLDITPEALSLVCYDESSPSGLSWTKTENKYLKGAPAGGRKPPNGYHIKLNYRSYLAHRVIWTLINGPIQSGFVIDHIDGNPFNNNLSNLRQVTKKTNNQNTVRGKSNLPMGITERAYNQKGSCRKVYIASCSNELKSYSKEFNQHYFTPQLALQMAIEWRENKLTELNSQGEDFSDRHIKGFHGINTYSTSTA